MARPPTNPIDIHRYERKLQYAEAQVRRSTLSARNKELIFAYRDACLLKNVCGRVRLIRVMGALTVMGRVLDKDFDTATRQDVERLITRLITHQPPYSPETISAYKAILRSFLTWVTVPDEFPTRHYPPLVAWISCHLKKRDCKRLSRHDLLTPKDIATLLGVVRNVRDKALISVLWESGGRIAEVGNPQLKHLTRHQHGYLLELTGKTGTRSVLLIESSAYLNAWLNQHPFANDPESPLWAHYHFETTAGYLKYDTIRNLLKNAFARAGMQKPFHPHIFRHSRATYLLARGTLTEQQAKAYFGWTPESDQLSTYSHLVDGDATNAILRSHNLAPATEDEPSLQPRGCAVCGALNPPSILLCPNCGTLLNTNAGIRQASMVPDAAMRALLEALAARGNMDGAVQLIHDAGLGPALERLAKTPATDKTTSVPKASQ